MAGKFKLSKSKNGKFKFNLHASNGRVILTSQTYAGKPAALNGIESVRKGSANDKQFDRKTAKDGSPYFTLLAKNKQVIGQSEMYSSKAGMEKGIASVAKHAGDAKVEDLT